MQKSTSTSDFNIKELRSSKLTIYLSSNMKDSERVQPIMQLIINIQVQYVTLGLLTIAL
jgi:type IV secretory pathway TraG/TraD family ATPase VirD4